ncbi:MAG: hypothetical protein WDA75_18025, partial [Candidatus Latescibacterota bacterium]
MTRSLRILALFLVLVPVFLFNCDRDRSNPLDPQADVTVDRPGAPEGLTAEPGIQLVRLSWRASEDADLAGYAVYRSFRSNGEYAFVAGEGDSSLGITTGKTSFVDSLGSSGGTWFYRVAAVDTTGTRGELSAFVGASPAEDRVPPESPLNLSVVADESRTGRAVVRWSAPRRDSDGGELSGLAGFVLFRAESGAGGFVPIDTLEAGARQYVDEGLKALTVYEYTLLAFDAAGNESELARSQQASSRGLAVPSGVRAEAASGRIEITWEAGASRDLLGYDLYRSTRSDAGYVRLPGSEGTTFTTGRTVYVDSLVSTGSVYYYRVQAIGTGGLTSELSAFVSAQSEVDQQGPGVPGNVSVVATVGVYGEVTVSWSAPTKDGDGGELTGLSGYVVYRSEETTDGFVEVGTTG